MQETFLINRKKKIESFKMYFLPWKHVSKREKQYFITVLLFFCIENWNTHSIYTKKL